MNKHEVGHYKNDLQYMPGWGSYWWHRYIVPPTPVIRLFNDKSLIEFQGQQRARDGAVRYRARKDLAD